MEYIKNCVFMCFLLVIDGITSELPQEAANKPIRISNISPEDQNKIYFIDSDEIDTKAPPPWGLPPNKSAPQGNVEIYPKILEDTKENAKPGFSLLPPPNSKEVNIVLGTDKEEAHAQPSFSTTPSPEDQNKIYFMDSDKKDTKAPRPWERPPDKSAPQGNVEMYPKILEHTKENAKPGFSLVPPPNSKEVNIVLGTDKEKTHAQPSFPAIPLNKVKNYFTQVKTKLFQNLPLFKNLVGPGQEISTQQVKKMKKRSLTREGTYFPARRSLRRNGYRYQPKEYPDRNIYRSDPTFLEEPLKKNYIDDDNYYKLNREINDRKYMDLNDVYILKPLDYPKRYKPITPRRSSPICGRKNTKPFSQNISGGTSVALGEYPWMALIQYRGRNKITNGCGGTLVNSRYVLTAAHCVDDSVLQKRNLKLHRIILGEYDTKTEFDCTEGPYSVCADAVKVYSAAEIIKHENFDTTNALHDIALIRLDVEVEFSDYVKPICLPTSNLTFNQNGKESLTVAGWGRTSTKGSYSRKLIKATLPVVSQDFCTIRGVTLTPGQLCLGLGSGIDTCTGDSGGPMMMQTLEDSEVVTYQMGIISYGFATEECGQAPSVNTFVPYYLDWVNSLIR